MTLFEVHGKSPTDAGVMQGLTFYMNERFFLKKLFPCIFITISNHVEHAQDLLIYPEIPQCAFTKEVDILWF